MTNKPFFFWNLAFSWVYPYLDDFLDIFEDLTPDDYFFVRVWNIVFDYLSRSKTYLEIEAEDIEETKDLASSSSESTIYFYLYLALSFWSLKWCS